MMQNLTDTNTTDKKTGEPLFEKAPPFDERSEIDRTNFSDDKNTMVRGLHHYKLSSTIVIYYTSKMYRFNDFDHNQMMDTHNIPQSLLADCDIAVVALKTAAKSKIKYVQDRYRAAHQLYQLREKCYNDPLQHMVSR